MTRNDIIRMAREAGFRAGHIEMHNGDPLPFIAPCSATDCLPELERFAAIVAAAHESRFKWYFKQVEPSGTVVARTPDGNEFVVKGGNFDTGAGRELLNAMIATLSGPQLPLRPIQRDRHDGRHAPVHTRACDVPDHCARQQHGGQRERQAWDCRQKLPENTDAY